MSFVEMGKIAGLGLQTMLLRSRIEELEERLAAANVKVTKATLRAEAAEKIVHGANLTVEEVAAFVGVSTRTVRRWDRKGTLPRCPEMGLIVRFTTRDVLRLASAPRKER